MSQTELTITNATNEDITVWITLGATSGCIQNVKDIPFVTSGSGLQGSFTLKKGSSESYIPPSGTGLNGNVTFGTPPMNCPNKTFETGVNLAEFVINNSFQSGSPQETIDISGVAGTNAYIKFSMTGGGKWNASSLHPDVTSFENKVIGKNKGNIGVFPYACENCDSAGSPVCSSNPPIGAPNPLTPQDNPICNVQRDASKAGGTVTITFKGFVS